MKEQYLIQRDLFVRWKSLANSVNSLSAFTQNDFRMLFADGFTLEGFQEEFENFKGRYTQFVLELTELYKETAEFADSIIKKG